MLRTGGDAAIGYLDNVMTGHGYDCRSGSCGTQLHSDRGYGVVLDPAPVPPTPNVVPQSQGVGTSWDSTTMLGESFHAGPGFIHGVCFYTLGAAGGTVTYTVGVSPVGPTLYTGVVLARSTDGWSCDAGLGLWPAATAFVERTGGDALVGYRDGMSNATGYDCRSGMCMSQPTSERGYGLIVKIP